MSLPASGSATLHSARIEIRTERRACCLLFHSLTVDSALCDMFYSCSCADLPLGCGMALGGSGSRWVRQIDEPRHACQVKFKRIIPRLETARYGCLWLDCSGENGGSVAKKAKAIVGCQFRAHTYIREVEADRDCGTNKLIRVLTRNTRG